MAPLVETECGDCLDNDCDGLVDEEDDDCAAPEPEVEACGDGIDNDLDGLVDCCDSDCVDDMEFCGPVACPRYMAPLAETECGDCRDNDCDGDYDADDADCA
jgi:hypothetical protein